MSSLFQIQTLFPLPLLARTIPDAAATNEALRRNILARERSETGMTRSNADGWHSQTTLLTWPEAEIATVRKWIDDATREISLLAMRGDVKKAVDIAYEAQGWANVNRNGNYNAVHTHPNSQWSMVYYVAMGEPESGHRLNGVIEFRDPRPAATEFPGFDFGQTWRITPEAGLFLVFPAWLEHMVHPFFGKGERISLAINVRFTQFRIRDRDAPASAVPAAMPART
jgi:uncharacterized protein (TIGR02466 family)